MPGWRIRKQRLLEPYLAAAFAVRVGLIRVLKTNWPGGTTAPAVDCGFAHSERLEREDWDAWNVLTTRRFV